MRIERFSFRSFDQPRPQAHNAVFAVRDEVESETPEPVVEDPHKYTDDDLENARREAHQKGFSAGMEAGQLKARNDSDDIQRQLLSISSPILIQLENMIAQYRTFLMTKTADTTRIALACARKVAGHALEQKPLAEIEAMVAGALPVLVGEPKITVSVHPDLVKPLEKHLCDTVSSQKEHTADITVTGDDSIELGNCRLDWKNGTAERNTEQLWQHISHIIEHQMPTHTQQAHVTAPVKAEKPVKTIAEESAATDEPSLAEDETVTILKNSNNT